MTLHFAWTRGPPLSAQLDSPYIGDKNDDDGDPRWRQMKTIKTIKEVVGGPVGKNGMSQFLQLPNAGAKIPCHMGRGQTTFLW